MDYDNELVAGLQKQAYWEAGYDCDYTITKAYADYTLENCDKVSAVSTWQGTLTIYNDEGGIFYKGRVTVKGKGTGNRGTISQYSLVEEYKGEESTPYSFNQRYQGASGPVTSIIGPILILP